MSALGDAIKAEAARELVGKAYSQLKRTAKGGKRKMSFDKDDILEALRLRREPSIGEWLGVAAIGFGVGALIGASTALLLAPRTGMQMRDDLMERGRRLVRRGREGFEPTEMGQNTMPTG